MNVNNNQVMQQDHGQHNPVAVTASEGSSDNGTVTNSSSSELATSGESGGDSETMVTHRSFEYANGKSGCSGGGSGDNSGKSGCSGGESGDTTTSSDWTEPPAAKSLLQHLYHQQHPHVHKNKIYFEEDKNESDHAPREVRMIRKMANRKAARESRERRRCFINDLQIAINNLAEENKEIAEKNAGMRRELVRLLEESSLTASFASS